MPTELDRNDVQRLVAAGAQLVEVLAESEYEAEHIAEALNIPLKKLNRETTAQLDRNRPVIVYCHDTQ